MDLQNKNNPNKRVMVSLTYDDALPVHHSKVAPLLEKHGLRVTFYLSVHHLLKDKNSIPAWREVAKRGHELGNHSLMHPCRMKPEFKRWLDEWRDLRSYTPERFREELRVANLALSLIDGEEIRSYGNTCCDTTIGSSPEEISMVPILKELFVGARGGLTSQIAHPDVGMNLFELGHFSGDGKTCAMLQQEVEKARASGGWLVYMFHGVGQGTHSLFIDEEEHRKFISWLAQQEDIYIAPFRDIALRFTPKIK